MSMERELFQNFLRSKGLKLTQERQRILAEVFLLHGHFNPEELLGSMRAKKNKISKASVYRTIPLLLESGLIQQVEKNDKRAHYEHTYGHEHHDHLICIKCGKVIEVYSPRLESIQDELCESKQFRGLQHTLEIKGYCSICNH